jgi:hypothetical protein
LQSQAIAHHLKIFDLLYCPHQGFLFPLKKEIVGA